MFAQTEGAGSNNPRVVRTTNSVQIHVHVVINISHLQSLSMMITHASEIGPATDPGGLTGSRKATLKVSSPSWAISSSTMPIVVHDIPPAAAMGKMTRLGTISKSSIAMVGDRQHHSH